MILRNFSADEKNQRSPDKLVVRNSKDVSFAAFRSSLPFLVMSREPHCLCFPLYVEALGYCPTGVFVKWSKITFHVNADIFWVLNNNTFSLYGGFTIFITVLLDFKIDSNKMCEKNEREN